jgi:hypothetical protein
MFDYLDFKNKIPIAKVAIGKIPSLNPTSAKFRQYWKPEKRRCIEGRWIEHNGVWRWVSGPLHFYINHWHILLNKKGGKSKTKSLGKPFLRDLEWIKTYVYAVARGFSGFADDDEYSCHRALCAEDVEFEVEMLEEHIRKNLYNKKGELKKYKEALEYLYEDKTQELGKPLYQNLALNVIDVESRGLGKSYLMSALCAHNFLFDGAMDYDEYLDAIKEEKPLNSETLIGAIDTKYSGDLISKVKLGLDNLEGGIIIGEKEYPAPLSKKFVGSWESGKTITQKYEKKIGGSWKWYGSYSKFQHRSFKDNPFAANGTRGGFNVIDEVGFMGNLEPVLGQMAECTADGAFKFGTIWMTGTGGDMEGGATEAAKRVFEDPAANTCMTFDDIFENTGKKIGFFVPAWMGLNQFKDELGNTNRDLAMRFLTAERLRKSKAKSKKPLNDELQQRPIIWSEAFLATGGNVFDSVELNEHLKFLETDRDGFIKGRVGTLVLEGSHKVEFKEDFTGRVKACDYPLQQKDDLEGAVVIWKTPQEVFPDGQVPYGAIIATLDPYAQDEAPNSVSLGSMQVFLRATINGQHFDEQIAEYTGRAASMSDFFENCRKLLIYYNALCLYENNYNQFKTHMQNRNCLHLLAKTPTALGKNKQDSIANTYGLRMTGPMKDELEKYTADWLLSDAGDGKLNLHHIYSVPLLKELKAYNDTGNFDRVIALCLFVAQKLQMAKIVSNEKKEKKQAWWLTHKYNGV